MAKKAYAFFDFDGTLIDGDSILLWLRYYYRHRPSRRFFQLVNAFGILLYLLRVITSHNLKRVFLWPMSFEKTANLEALASAFVHEDLVFRFRPNVLERLWAHHFLGHKIVVISASGTFYLKYIQSILPQCQILGSELLWRSGPFWLPAYVDGNLRGENKMRRLQALGLGESGPGSFAYSDHQHDIPLLSFVEYPVCVRPTHLLTKHAKKHHWMIWNWSTHRPWWKAKLDSLMLLFFAVSLDADASEGATLPGRPRQDAMPPFMQEHVQEIETLKKSEKIRT